MKGVIDDGAQPKKVRGISFMTGVPSRWGRPHLWGAGKDSGGGDWGRTCRFPGDGSGASGEIKTFMGEPVTD